MLSASLVSQFRLLRALRGCRSHCLGRARVDHFASRQTSTSVCFLIMAVNVNACGPQINNHRVNQRRHKQTKEACPAASDPLQPRIERDRTRSCFVHTCTLAPAMRPCCQPQRSSHWLPKSSSQRAAASVFGCAAPTRFTISEKMYSTVMRKDPHDSARGTRRRSSHPWFDNWARITPDLIRSRRACKTSRV